MLCPSQQYQQGAKRAVRLTHAVLRRRGVVMAPHTGAILLVDDEPSIVRVLATLLRRQGYNVTTAVNGAHAWAHIRTQSYDVIVCDLVMPVMDGPTLYTRLQQHDPALCARVIFLTGDTVGARSMAFLRQCGQPWLYKPCVAAEILRTIEQMLHAAPV